MTKALTNITKRIYYSASAFFVSGNTIIKYPIFLDALINRIKRLQLKYSLPVKIHIYHLGTEVAKAKKELKGKGGVYVLWCRTTGLFYVGSCVHYFSVRLPTKPNESTGTSKSKIKYSYGRLNSYVKPGAVKSTLEGKSTGVSKDLAIAIAKYGIGDFVLLIPQDGNSVGLTIFMVQTWEQLFMLLNPTLNRTLFAYTNSGAPMPEETRIKMSIIFYQYELDENNQIIDGTEKPLCGLKDASYEGIVSKDGVHFPIQYGTLKGHLTTGMVWYTGDRRFFFSSVPCTNSTLVVNPAIASNSLLGTGSRSRPV